MNNTYNRMVDLVVYDQLEEAMTVKQRIAAGAIALGAAGGLGTHMARTGGTTPNPATLTRSIGQKARPTTPTNAELATPTTGRTTVKPKDMFTQDERYPKGSAKENLMQQYNRLNKRRQSEREDDLARGAKPQNRKPLVKPYKDRYGDWQPGPKPDESKKAYDFPDLPQDALDRANETPEDRQKRLHREGKVKNSYLPDN
jgi:hypothetical protein